MSQTFNRATGWIVRRPWLALLMILIISSFAIIGYKAPRIFDNLFEVFNKVAEQELDQTPVIEPPGSQEYRNVRSIDLNSHAVMLVQSDSIFSPEGANCLRAVVEKLDNTDYISDVFWMDEVPPMNAFGLPEPLLPRGDASEKRFEMAKRKGLNHPFIVGQLMSADAESVLLLVNFNWIYLKENRDCIEGLREIAESTAAKFPGVEMKFSVTGRVPIELTALESHESNQFIYQLVAYSMIAIMSIILFRGVSAVVVVAMAPALGVFWTLGFIRYFEFQFNPFNDVVLPILVSLVGFTDGVHLMVQIRRNRAGGMTPLEAAESGVNQVGLACFLTSLTTAIGFGSLWLAHQDLVREFGACCVIGVFCSFIAVITTIPLACSTWLGKRVHVGHEKSLIDQNLNRIGSIIDYVLERKTTFSLIGLATTAILLSVSLTLRPDEKQSNALPVGSESSVALAEMDKAMGGLEQSRVEISWNSEVQPDSPEIVDVIGKVDELLEQEPLIGHPVSIRKIIAALPGQGDVSGRMSMVELLPPSIKRSFYSPEESSAQIRFRVQDLGIARYGPVFERILAGFDSIRAEHSNFDFELQGNAVWRWKNLYQIVVDLAASLGVASLIIFCVLAVVYRSLRIGLISIVPNIFPLTVAGAFLVATGQALEIVTVCAFTVCLGIAVDDTIHFLTRFYEERKNGGGDEVVIRRAFTGVGTALIITTVVLVSGFMTVLFSDSRDHHTFASMGAITISAALFGDLVFLPALLAKFAKKK